MLALCCRRLGGSPRASGAGRAARGLPAPRSERGRARPGGGPRRPVPGRLGDPAGGAARVRSRARRRRGGRRRAAPLPYAAARPLPDRRRVAGDPGNRDRADPRDLVRIRNGSQADGHRPDLLLPDHRQHPRRPAARSTTTRCGCCARWAPAAGDLFRRLELPSALPYLFSGAKVADRRRGDRRGLRRARRLRRGARPRDPGRHGPAADGAGVRGSVLLLAAMAIALFALVSAVERRAVPWARGEGTLG